MNVRDKVIKELLQDKDLGLTKLSDHVLVSREDGGSLYAHVDSSGNITMATIMPNKTSTAIEYLNKIEDFDPDFNDRESIIKAVKRVMNYGILADVLDVLTDIYTYSGYFLSGVGDRGVKDILKYWLDGINGYLIGKHDSGGIGIVAQAIIHDVFAFGDFVGIEIWDKVEYGGRKNLFLPVQVIQFDVEKMDIDEGFKALNQEVFVVEIDEKLSELFNGKNDEYKALINQLPDEVVNALKSGEDRFLLNGENVIHFSRKKNLMPGWGKSYFQRVIPLISIKERLRILDKAIIDGLIQRSIIIMVGSDDKDSPYHVPSEDRIAFAKKVFKDFKSGNILIWGGKDLSTLEINATREEILGFTERYKEIDNDILMSLGIPRFLLDGSGASKVDIKAVIKIVSMMSNENNKIAYWVNNLIRKIVTINKLGDVGFKFRWKANDLTSKDGTKSNILKMREFGLIGLERAINELGYDADEVIAELINESESGMLDRLPTPFIPYQGRGNYGDKNDGVPRERSSD